MLPNRASGLLEIPPGVGSIRDACEQSGGELESMLRGWRQRPNPRPHRWPTVTVVVADLPALRRELADAYAAIFDEESDTCF